MFDTLSTPLAVPVAATRAFGAVMNAPRVVGKMEPGGGLVSTAPDYARFLMMLRNGGQLDGKRYLSPRTLEYMTSDLLAPSVVETPLYLPGPGYGFGLGFAVRTSGGEAASTPARSASTAGEAPASPACGSTRRPTCSWSS